jgi:probable F420-dependent oxidoreductase
MNLGKLGVWAMLDKLTASETAALAKRLEDWGYSALWQAEGFGRDVMVESGWLIAHSDRLIAASGIANIYARDPVCTVAAQHTLFEQAPGRFLLGLGVSHGMVVEWRGHAYAKPIEAMRSYLTAIRGRDYQAPKPAGQPPTVIAALGPKMLELAASHADGAHPYNVTPEHTAEARRIMGPGKLLCVEHKVMLESDPAKARATGREVMKHYLQLPNYVAHWRRLGFGDADLTGLPSDRLIDAMIAWGDEDAVLERVRQHLDAGADHVCIQAISPTGDTLVDQDAMARIAASAKARGLL